MPPLLGVSCAGGMLSNQRKGEACGNHRDRDQDIAAAEK